MIFRNPAGAPELACDTCGCRWFDRMTNTCYECGAEVTGQMEAEFCAALEDFNRNNKAESPVPADPYCRGGNTQ
jgi:hypothetical protein